MAFEDLYRSIDPADTVRGVCYHYHQRGDSESSTLQELIDRATIVANLAKMTFDPTEYLRQNHPHTACALVEVSSALDNVGNAPLEGVLGTALWEGDFLLHAMSHVGISSLEAALR